MLAPHGQRIAGFRVGYSSVNPAVAKYSYQFEEQAEKLFAAEGKTDALPTIAGLALLYTTIATHGDVPKALKYLTAAREAADRMNLFGKPDSAAYGSPKHVAAASQTAWGLFNFLVQMVQFQVVQPLEHPPVMPLPEELRSNKVTEGSSEQNAVSTSPTLREVQQAQSVFCRLWTIVNEIFLIYRDSKIGARSLAFALGKYRKLLDLIDTLPESMIRREKTPHWVLIFHTSLHMVVLDLFRPYIAEDKQHGFRAYVPEGSSPRTIFAASVRQLKGMLFMFTVQYAPAYWNLALSGAMVFTVNAVLNDLADQERKNYLYFCVSMSQRLLPSYTYMIETIRAILAIATDKGAITSIEAINIEMESASLQRNRRTERSKGGWTVAPTINDNKAGAIDTLADRFETITLFNEFTEDGYQRMRSWESYGQKALSAKVRVDAMRDLGPCCSHLANVGDAKTLINHPLPTTHQQTPDEEKIKGGATPDSICVSLDFERIDSTIHNLEQVCVGAGLKPAKGRVATWKNALSADASNGTLYAPNPSQQTI
ncbi:hypothetical protein E8E12_004363 [Didymella heteroderae]|uniref:Sequence-specific DNA binding RNA polymerase II transcription factor n=1 Tax=Didymella heteroderae TaxID=1769908 RepID=A0A9P5BY94_9PLEO|nr:hypothetical protein E8E12_004363 [Didymella heteroderae]